MSAYSELETVFRRIGAVDEAARVLHWDMSVMMPPGGAGARTEQLAHLRVLSHEQLTASRVGELFDAAEADPPRDRWQAANLHEMRRRWRHAVAVESALVESFSKACSRCELIWREARPKSDFASIVGALAEVLALVRDIASAKADALGVSRYEALLDQFEPQGSTAAIDALFADLAGFLPGLLDDVLSRQRRAPAPVTPSGPFPVEAQRALAVELMQHLGFDFDHGRLDVSLHPFCSGVPDDVRITTRYNEDDFLESLMGVLHETGHALYERGLPAAWRLQPVGEARGMAVHESQSLLVEMQACRGSEFVAFAAPLMRRAFGGSGPAWSPENLARLYTRVEPGFIRVDADEVTYPAHVILRYRLERAMIDGALGAADLPAAWNDGMRELLGLEVPDDRHGCLQDIHWFDGAFGYFPTYTLGALTAAQLFAAAARDNPDIRPAIGRGEFAPLLAWLRENVHGKGSLLPTDALIREATGQPLGTAAFKAHLERRYLA